MFWFKKIICLTIIISISLVVNLSGKTFRENNTINIPDKNFKQALIELGIDKNKDNQISYQEVKGITSLNIVGKKITDLTGLENFISLKELDCKSNEFANLDLTKNLREKVAGTNSAISG